MWSYYGSKSKVVQYYPEPRFGRIIEPFAGTARYSLRYWESEVLLIEKFDILFRIWKWLQGCSPSDITRLPKMSAGETTDDFQFECQEAKWLMGFMVQGGVNAPRKTVSSVGNFGSSIERDKARIARDLHKIRHWDIKLGDYHHAPNSMASTWFIDPPYQFGGQYYHSKVNNSHIDYAELRQWCESRKGQVIVCENTKATWIPVSPLRKLHGSKNSTIEGTYEINTA